MLAQTQCDGQFFRAQFNIIRREIGGEIALIVAGTTADGTFEQPLGDTILPATAHLADLAQQGRNMDCITEPSGQGENCLIARSFPRRNYITAGMTLAIVFLGFPNDGKAGRFIVPS